MRWSLGRNAFWLWLKGGLIVYFHVRSCSLSNDAVKSRTCFPKNMYDFCGKHVRVFCKSRTCFLERSYVFSWILPPKTIAHAKIYKKLHLNEMLNEKALLIVESTGKYSIYSLRLFVFSAILCNFAYAWRHINLKLPYLACVTLS